MAAKVKTPTAPKVKVDWAFVDVKAGRNKLLKIIGERHSKGPHHRVPVTLTGFLDDIHSGDDGVSREFGMTVTGVQLGTPSLV